MITKRSGRLVLAGTMIGALGVVYGDIGTSPLYALRECFAATHGVAPTVPNVLGLLSLVFWSLVLIVCVKYLLFVLRADNRGEGGILALLALTLASEPGSSRRRLTLTTLGIFGAALLYGDGIITPCITVLGAVEGLQVATPMFTPYIVPISIGVLIGLFALQRLGTGGMGNIFGPITLVWFITIGALGLRGIAMEPAVLWALNPWRAVTFLSTNGSIAVVVLGSVFLAVTGAEALYADLGHFGARPIRLAWFVVVFPSLVLNYFGQGALMISRPETVANPFYYLAPNWALLPLVALATAASVIASQALISGAFSLTMQGIQLGYLPRMEIRHTSMHTRGQIYMPLVNVALMVACIALVLGFRSSGNLSAAYGIAVTLTMLITSILFYFVARRTWGWRAWQAGLLCGTFIAVELVFCAANAVKIGHGGWLPLAVAAGIFVIMTTWHTGRLLLRDRLEDRRLPFDVFLASIRDGSALRAKGTAVYMSGNSRDTPIALLHNLKHNKVLHERIVLLTIVAEENPHVNQTERAHVEPLAAGFFRVIARFGFMETPDIGDVLLACRAQGLELSVEFCSFFLSRETIVPGKRPIMSRWRSRLFAFLARNAQTAAAFFGLPANRVVELGLQVEL
ncbi:MAG: potassium transporter Kup [bacterium]